MNIRVLSGRHAEAGRALAILRGLNFGCGLNRVAGFVLGAALIGALFELLAGPAYRLGWIALRPGLQAMRWAATAEAVVLGLALLGALAAFGKQLRRARKIFTAASIISLLAAAPPALLWYRVQHLPHIHDISTDTANPPEYRAVLPLRKNDPNSTVYDSRQAALQNEAYPDVRTLLLKTPPRVVFDDALRIAGELGWDIVEANASALRIEATDTSLLFGFKDDVVIRIEAVADGSRIDLRSLSRVGGSDFGVNAKRIRRFISRLQDAGK
jgi:uncharacterized protein (DUF1499 family)